MDTHNLQGFIKNGFPCHAALGVKRDTIEEGLVRLCIPFKQDLIGHAQSDMLHGGVISSLADICVGFAVWTRCSPQDNLVTLTLSVDFLRPAVARNLYAETTVRLLGNRVGNAHVELWVGDQRDAHVAEGRGVYNIKRNARSRL